MFESIMKIFKKLNKKNEGVSNSKDAAKERLHLVLMQDRANVSADFLELMKQEIIDVIKKYIDVDENEIDVRLTNKENSDGTNGAPALYANIPILNIKNEARKADVTEDKGEKVEKSNKENENDEIETEIEDNKSEKENEKTENDEKKIKNESSEEIKEDKNDIDEEVETKEKVKSEQ